MNMKYEVVEDRLSPGDFRAEAINSSGDGEVFGAIFTGPDADERAHEYAAWQNGTEVASPQYATSISI